MMKTMVKEVLEELEQIDFSAKEWKSLVKGIVENLVVQQEKSLEVVKNLVREIVDKRNEKKLPPMSEEKKTKKKKEFHFEQCRQRHIAFQIQYDGGKYHGFASQESTETVENSFFDVLMKLKLIQDPKTCQYSRCGRTDKGVSAMGQIVALNVRSAVAKEIPDELIPLHPGDVIHYPVELVQKSKPSGEKLSTTSATMKTIQEMDYCTMINALLPEDIRVIGWTPVTPNFSARFSATHRTYRYFFHRHQLNIDAMQQACTYLIGSHDFRNFCKLDIANVTNFIREIFHAKIICYEDQRILDPALSIYYFEVKGIAFLWHMVRCIMAVLFLIGEEKESPEIVLQLLSVANNPGKPSYTMADDAPLVLQECGFENLTIYHTPKTLWNLTQHYQQLRNRSLLMATRAKNCVETLLEEAEVRSQDLSLFIDHLREKVSNTESQEINKRRQGGAISSHKRTFATMEGIETNESLEITKMESETGSKEYLPETLRWKDGIRKIYEETKLQPGDKTQKYIPLLQRKKEESYEERVEKLLGQKKDRFERHIHLSESAKESTPDFFDAMRKEGTLRQSTK